MAVNFCFLEGRVCNDIELKKTQSDISIASFAVAVNRPKVKDKPQEVDFINIVAWRKNAEFVSKYFHKGDPIGIQGKLQVRTYNDANGNKRYITEVLADSFFFTEQKKKEQNDTQLNGEIILEGFDDDEPIPF